MGHGSFVTAVADNRVLESSAIGWGEYKPVSIYQYERDRDLEALSEALVNAESASVRRQAARALGELDPPEHQEGAYRHMLQSLRTAAVEDDDEAVRMMSVSALESHGIEELRRLVRDLTDEPVDSIGQRAYVSLIRSPRPELRMAGLSAIGLDGTPKSAKAVIQAFDDPNPRVREHAISAAADLGLSRAKSQLVGALDDDVPAVRAAAASAIGELNLKQAADALALATEDDNESVRLAALDALASLGSPAAIDPLASSLGSASPAVNRLAVYGLLELLTNVSGSASQQVRSRVEELVQDAPRTTVIDTLLELLEAMDGTIQRRNAIWLLGRIIDERPTENVVKTLADHVGHEDDQTAKFATGALVRSEGVIVERIVRLRLEDSDPNGRPAGQLAYVLGRIGSGRSKDAIESALEATENDAVRQQLVGALKRIEQRRGAG